MTSPVTFALDAAQTASAASAAHVSAPPLSPAFYAALLLYLVSAVLYVGLFADARPAVIRAARWAMAAAFAAHSIDIGWRGVQDLHPGSSVFEALGFSAWFLIGAFLLFSLRQRFQIIGAFVAIAGFVILAVARLSPAGAPLSELSLLGRIHIAMAAVGVAILTLPAALAIIYLLKDRQLRRKEFDGILLHGGASALESHDVWAYRLILVGFPVFTASLILGAIWVSQRASGFSRPEYAVAGVAWLSFAGIIAGREAVGWRGRRAAWMTLAGFALAVVVFGIYLARRVGL